MSRPFALAAAATAAVWLPPVVFGWRWDAYRAGRDFISELGAAGGLVAMGAPELTDVRGAAQRVVEAAVFAWLLVEARVAGQAGSGV